MPDKLKAKPNPAAPFVSEDSESCVKHFSKVVESLPLDQLETLNADPAIVRVNVQRGVDEVRAHLDHVAKALPLLDANRFLELPSLVLALTFVNNRLFTPASPQEIAVRQATLRPSRRLTLAYLEIAAELKLVPSEPVAAIRADNGAIDEANDGIAIAAFFREKSAALAGKHPFPPEMLKKLDEDGHWLAKQLVPSDALRTKGETNPDAILRDRLWTEIVNRFDDLYQAGVAIWGRRGVDKHIPGLRARAVTKAAPVAPEKSGTPEGG